MMKKTYIQPLTEVKRAQCEMLLAASMFDSSKDEQSIEFTNEEYNESFTVKEYNFGDDF